MKMSVDMEITLRMARAAQIRVAPDDVGRMMDSINDILSFCALVGDLDCTDTPDFTWRMKKRPSRRPDTVMEWEDRERFKEKAPAIDGNFFRVPRISSEA